MKRILLIVACIAGFCLLGAACFFILGVMYESPLGIAFLITPFLTVIVFIILFTVFLIKKKRTNHLLVALFVVLDCIGVGVLGVFYFFGFDIQWGVNKQALTWGIPVLIGVALLIIEIIFMLKQKDWKKGLLGLGIWCIAFLYIGIMQVFFSYLIIGEPENGPKETLDTEENRALELVLKNFFKDGPGYAVIQPKTTIRYLISPQEDIEEAKKHMFKGMIFFNEDNISLNITSTNISENELLKLADNLLELNQQSKMLQLKSSPKDGYYIDYDKKFSRYFKDGAGEGWAKWRLSHPVALPYVDLSLPAYDSETGLILIYLGGGSASLSGSGYIYLLKYENNELKTIGVDRVWIS